MAQDSLKGCSEVGRKYTGQCIEYLNEYLLRVNKAENAKYFYVQDKVNGKNFQDVFRRVSFIDYLFGSNRRITYSTINNKYEIQNDTIEFKDMLSNSQTKVFFKDGKIFYVEGKSLEPTKSEYKQVCTLNYSDTYNNYQYSYRKTCVNQDIFTMDRYLILKEKGWTYVDVKPFGTKRE